MTSFLSPNVATTRPRSISNGGLGGLKVLPSVDSRAETWNDNGTWPRSKQRPPPLRILLDDEEVLVPVAQRSAVLPQEKSQMWWPQTPKTPPQAPAARSISGDKDMRRLCAPVSRFNNAADQSLSSPGTPATEPWKANLPSKVVLAELPGSLLLPSQGFPPPPFTPPRSEQLPRINSSDSDLSSLPSLTPSSSTSPPEIALMKSFNHATRLRTLLDPEPTMQSTDTAQTASDSKPFNAMSLEELLVALPVGDESKILQVWLPEMQDKIKEVKLLLQESAEVRLESHQRLNDLGTNLRNSTQEARVITNSYRSALKSAQSLLERDTIDLQERLHFVEGDLEVAQHQINAANRTIGEKDDSIKHLQQYLDHIAHVLGTFVRKNVGNWIEDFQNVEMQTVMEVLEDFSPDSLDANRNRFIRVSESSHQNNLVALRQAHTKLAYYQEVVETQDAMIKEQSSQLDHQVDKYANVLATLGKRDQEVERLEQRQTELQKQVETCETKLQRSHLLLDERTRARDEALKTQQASLTRQDQLQRHIDHATKYYAAVLNEKQTIIDDLKSQLGSAREEILARQHDVRNVLSHTQAMLSAHPASSVSSGPNLSKAHKILGKDRDKENEKQKRSIFDRKGLSPISPTDLCSPADPRFSSKEFAGTKHPVRTSSSMAAGAESPRNRHLNDPFTDFGARANSLAAGRQMASSKSPRNHAQVVNTSKQLPTVPTSTSQMSNRESNRNKLQESPTPKTSSTTEASNIPCLSQGTPKTPVRRVLSLIPEGSAEGSSSAKTMSITNSDKDICRRSMRALDVLNSKEARASPSEEQDLEATRKASEDTQGGSSQSDGSEMLSVAQLYHSHSS